MYTDRERKKERGFTFSLFALIHSLKRKFRVNDENHGLTRSCGESLHAVLMLEVSFVALQKTP